MYDYIYTLHVMANFVYTYYDFQQVCKYLLASNQFTDSHKSLVNIVTQGKLTTWRIVGPGSAAQVLSRGLVNFYYYPSPSLLFSAYIYHSP